MLCSDQPKLFRKNEEDGFKIDHNPISSAYSVPPCFKDFEVDVT